MWSKQKRKKQVPPPQQNAPPVQTIPQYQKPAPQHNHTMSQLPSHNLINQHPHAIAERFRKNLN